MRRAVTLPLSAILLAVAACSHNDPKPPTNAPAAESPAHSAGADWSVTGRVTDPAGQPIADVEIIAYCGAGTLRPTGRTRTDAAGRYELHFGPGMLFMNDHSGLQAATITPRKAGLYEQNLHRHGDLLMAKRAPDDDEAQSWDPDRTILLPDRPHRLDFVMTPAAALTGRLVDTAGRPVADHYISLDADELPPSSSALASVKTDPDGRFSFTEIPTGRAWLSIRCPQDKHVELSAAPLDFAQGDIYSAELVYDPAARTLTMRNISARRELPE